MRSLRAACAGAAIAVALAALAGCGQKGPLYLPDKKTGVVVPAATPPAVPAAQQAAPQSPTAAPPQAAPPPPMPSAPAPASTAPKKSTDDDATQSPP